MGFAIVTCPWGIVRSGPLNPGRMPEWPGRGYSIRSGSVGMNVFVMPSIFNPFGKGAVDPVMRDPRSGHS